MSPKRYHQLPYGVKAYHVVYNVHNGCRTLSPIYKTKSGAMKLYKRVIPTSGKPELYERIRGINDAGSKIL